MAAHKVRFLEVTALEARRAQQGEDYLEFLRESSMSAGIYVLPVGGVDRQSPHRQDEMYFVVSGRGRMRAGSEDHAVGPGSVIFIAADAQHRFYDIEEELTLLVIFAPAESA
jgi:mannose-6-phosphate isomerase-like protein (cupin superfamily)